MSTLLVNNRVERMESEEDRRLFCDLLECGMSEEEAEFFVALERGKTTGDVVVLSEEETIRQKEMAARFSQSVK